MHLLFYTHSIADLKSFSTLWTVAIIAGAAYGALRLVRDVTRLLWRVLTGALNWLARDERWPKPDPDRPRAYRG